MHANVNIFMLVTVLCGLTPGIASTNSLTPATRSGRHLPEKRTVDVRMDAVGIYVPRVEALSNGNTRIFGGTLIWNYRLGDTIGVFGQHMLSTMGWKNISLLAFGHEVGTRFHLGDYLAFEAAYLVHRIEYEWVDGEPWSIGGLHDHGVEVGMWGHLKPLGRLHLAGHLFGRQFFEPPSSSAKSYTTQLVFGAGVRSNFSVTTKHQIEVEIALLRVYRGPGHRIGTPEITWNTLGTALWRTALDKRFGIHAGMRAATHWWCGSIPMLELKRSMIDEPMVEIFIGIYFSI